MDIDKNIVKAAARYALMHFKKGSHWGDSLDPGEIRQEILDFVIEESWVKALKAIDAFILHGSAPVAEAVVAACIHAGIDKQKVRMVHFNGFFMVDFPHMAFSIRKEISGYIARPEVVKTITVFQTVIGLNPDEFVQFLFAFDALYPDMLKAVDELMECVNDIILERKREQMVKQLQEVTVKELVDQYLTPLKIKCYFSVRDANVHLRLRKGKTLEGYMDIPFDKLKERLQDLANR